MEKNNPAFSNQYAIAKQLQVECVVDELLDIADDSSKDQIIDAEGQLHFNSQAVQRARLRINTRKWLACKLVPKVYGTFKHENITNLSVVEKLIDDLKI